MTLASSQTFVVGDLLLDPGLYFATECGLFMLVTNRVRLRMDNVCSTRLTLNLTLPESGTTESPWQLSRLLPTLDPNHRRIHNIRMRQKNAF